MTVELPGIGEEYIVKEKYRSNLAMFEELAKRKEIGDSVTAEKLRHEIIEANKNLAYWIANHFSESAEVEKGDIQSFAFEGLIYAVDNFDDKMGYRFSTYAFPCITGTILSGISKSRAVSGLDANAYRSLQKAEESSDGYDKYISKTYSERREVIIRRLVRINKNNSSYVPSEAEIAEEFAEETSKLLELYERARQETISLDAPREVYSYDNQGVIKVDQDVVDKNPTNDPVEVVHQAFLAEKIREALNILEERQMLVIALRFGLSQIYEDYAIRNGDQELLTKIAIVLQTKKPRNSSLLDAPDGFTLETTGNILGLSKSRIDQIEREAMRNIRRSESNQDLLDCE